MKEFFVNCTDAVLDFIDDHYYTWYGQIIAVVLCAVVGGTIGGLLGILLFT